MLKKLITVVSIGAVSLAATAMANPVRQQPEFLIETIDENEDPIDMATLIEGRPLVLAVSSAT